MVRKSITLVLVITHLMMVVSCTYTEKVVLEEIKEGETIETVVLNSGDTVEFDKNGAKYQGRGEEIHGTTEEGDSIRIPFSKILGFRLERAATVEFQDLTAKGVAEIVLRGHGLIQFDASGGHYDTTTRMLSGKSRELKQHITVPLDQVKEFRPFSPPILTRDGFRAKGLDSVTEIILGPPYSVRTFDRKSGKLERPPRMVIAGQSKSGETVEIGLEDILYMKVRRVDAAGTVFMVIGGIAIAVVVVILIILATKQSCPFVYSHDGSRYVFDAEPLGGAISKGLAKTDYSRLEHLKPVDGNYQLLLRNEVEETQYLNELKLLVIDHKEGTEVFPTSDGKFHVVSAPKAAFRAFDEDGNDLRKFVNGRDEVEWQTKLPKDSTRLKPTTRHTLTFEFPKPRDARNGRLLIRAGTSLWGSNMIREMLSLRGKNVDEWYAGIDRGGPEMTEMVTFMAREELYWLNVYARAGETWVHTGFVPGGGPLVHEDRSIIMDLSRIQADTLAIQLRPPYGFWAIDYVGMDYETETTMTTAELPPISAVNQNGEDVTEALSKRDDQMHEMPRVGDWTKVSYEVPSQSSAIRRSVFLKTAGYYTLHMDKTKPEETSLLAELHQTPGLIIHYAMKKFLEWQSSLAAQQLERR